MSLQRWRTFVRRPAVYTRLNAGTNDGPATRSDPSMRSHSSIVIPLLAAAALGMVGCDIPTSLPRYDTVWELVLARDTVRVDDFLPAEMRSTPEGLVVDSFLVRDSVRLGEVCELCTCFGGPIPELDLDVQEYGFDLPGRLIEARLEEGTAVLRLTNGLGFDLLDDGLGNRGMLRAQLVDGRTGDTLVTRVVSEPFPNGSTLTLEFPLAGILAHTSLVTRVSGSTPGSSCDDLALDPNDGLDVEVELRGVRTLAATVLVVPTDLAPPEESAALPGLVAERFGDARTDLVAELLVESTLGLPVNLDLSVAGRTLDLFSPAAALTTPVEVAGGSPQVPARLMREYVIAPELLANADSVIAGARTFLPSGGLVVVRGGEQVIYDLRLRARVPTR